MSRATVLISTGFILVVAAFSSTWMPLFEVWADYFTHAFLAVALAIALIWQRRHQYSAGLLGKGAPWLTVPVAGLSVLWLLAGLAGVQAVQRLAMLGILIGWAGVVTGGPGLIVTVPVAGVALLAIPVWGILTVPLQHLTVLASGSILGLLGFAAEIRETYIVIPYGSFEVAGTCAGVNFLMAGLTLGSAYALLFFSRARRQLAIVAAAAVLAIVGNWIRVATLVMIGHWTEMQSSLMEAHAHYGWIVFTLTLAPLFVIGERLDRNREEPVHTRHESHGALESRGAVLRIGMATAAACLGPVLYGALLLTADARPVRAALSGTAPDSTWSPTDVPSPSWLPEYSGYDAVVRDAWSNGDGTIQVVRLVYREQAQGKELVNEQNRLAPEAQVLLERTIGPVDATGRRIGEAIIRTEGTTRLVWWWFHVAGRDTPSSTRAKLLEIAAQLESGAASELVTVETLCQRDSCVEAAATLADFVLGRREVVE